MTPTPYAVTIQERVHLLVQQARAVLTPEQPLDLATLRRTFTIQGHDVVTSLIAPALVTAVLAGAPGVAVRFLAEAAWDTSDLRHGRVDLEVGASTPSLPEIRSETVGRAPLAVALRPDHPLSTGDLTAEAYAGARHVIVSRRGRLHDRIDDVLAERGLHRQVVASAPTSTVALQVAQRTAAIVTVPADGCRELIAALGLRTRPFPLDLDPVPVVCAWHQRYDTDPAHTWLRGQVIEALTGTLR